MDETRHNPVPQQSSADPRLAHQKVLQPSESFAEEMKTSQQAAATTNNETPRPVAPASSIYPEPIVDIGTRSNSTSPSAASPNATAEAADKGAKQASKIAAVRIVASLLIITDAINVYNWYLGERAGYANVLSIIGIGIGLALAIGILKLNEVARSIYVLLSALMLALTAFSLLMFFISASHGSSNITNTHITKSQLENSIAQAQKNSTLTPAQKQQLIQTLQRQIATAPTDNGSLSSNIQQYAFSGLVLLTSVFPLVFLTRPSIKEVFK